MTEPESTTLYDLLMLLRRGGRIVRRVDCTAEELLEAIERRRLFTDKDGVGYVYLPPAPRVET